MVEDWVEVRKHTEREKSGWTDWLEHTYPTGLSNEPNNRLAGLNQLVFLHTNAAREWEQMERTNMRRPLAAAGIDWIFSTPPKATPARVVSGLYSRNVIDGTQK